MKKYIQVLKKTKLFAGVREEELEGMLSCLGARMRSYQKDEYVLRQGEALRALPVLVQGRLHIRREDYWGNCSILGQVTPGELFGEAYAMPDGGGLLNDVVALEDSVLIFFDIQRILTTCPSACKFHTLTVQNLFFALSEKNRGLVQKLGHLSKRSIREKVISYLSEQSQKHHSADFEIPFNRQQLADFLSVDRSALSNELCKMRDEGLLSFQKNRFSLK